MAWVNISEPTARQHEYIKRVINDMCGQEFLPLRKILPVLSRSF
jgi:hypothetical protein